MSHFKGGQLGWFSLVLCCLLTNHQIRHQAAHKVDCQPGDCIWSLQSSSWICVGIYGLTYSLYHPRGEGELGTIGVDQGKTINTTWCLLSLSLDIWVSVGTQQLRSLV